jgi:hypothetical protein
VNVVGVVGFRVIITLVEDSAKVIPCGCGDADGCEELQAGLNLFAVLALAMRLTGCEEWEQGIGGAADGVTDATGAAAGANIGEVPAAVGALAFGEPFEGEADGGFASGRPAVFGDERPAAGFRPMLVLGRFRTGAGIARSFGRFDGLCSDGGFGEREFGELNVGLGKGGFWELRGRFGSGFREFRGGFDGHGHGWGLGICELFRGVGGLVLLFAGLFEDLFEDHVFGGFVGGTGEAGGEWRQGGFCGDFESSECECDKGGEGESGADGGGSSAAFEFLQEFFGGFAEFWLGVGFANAESDVVGGFGGEAEAFKEAAKGDF